MKRFTNIVGTIGVLTILLVACQATPLLAQDEAVANERVALRLGVGLDPDQFVAGLYTYAGSLSENLAFMPYADVGIGDDAVVLTGNADFRLSLVELHDSPAVFYVSAAPTIAFIDTDYTDGDVEIGASLAFGLTKLPIGSQLFNLEARAGLGDIPDGKLLLGFWL